MRAAKTGLNQVLEQPALHRLLPPLNGLRVLDIGCGAGDFARHARSRGASHVLGIDVSERMLELARAGTSDPAIEYRRTTIETLPSFPVPFDLAVSSLALHYVEDYAGALARIAQAIRPGGHLVFSVEHPMMTALPEQSWQRDADGKALYWPIDNYAEEGVR